MLKGSAVNVASLLSSMSHVSLCSGPPVPAGSGVTVVLVQLCLDADRTSTMRAEHAKKHDDKVRDFTASGDIIQSYAAERDVTRCWLLNLAS